ncbi:MAG TPA: cell division protein FtsZ [Panacibacter sp.]|nr:cell division protein FtsZ [Panacibacter sp.]HNP44404.1 cell division protein FtsZ [Panacibacter sp.]
MIHFDLPKQKSSIIKVLGVGGGGSNAVNYMFAQDIEGVDFIICNTDAKALEQSRVPNKIQLGPHLTQGLGAGANPEVGKQATEESLEEIRRILEVNTKMAFITAGMGGGTGTGGAPIIAKICRELGILTVAIVTTPFQFEGPRRLQQAEEGIRQLQPYVDTLLVISNDKLRMQYGNLKMTQAFGRADNVLATAAKCITDIINSKGTIIVDFADVCTVMKNGGVAILGSAAAEGENRAQLAIEEALNSPLLNDSDIRGARWILVNINSAEGEHECTMDEFEIINNYLRQQSGENSDLIIGSGYDNELGGSIGITIIATGFEFKDPFAKKDTSVAVQQPKVAAPPVVEKIVMTLGIDGEEKKMYGQQPIPFEEKDPFAPKLVEEEAPLPVFNMVPMQAEPEPERVSSAEALRFELKAETREETPTFKLAQTEMPKPAEPVMQIVEKNEPAPVNLPPLSYLHRPANIYADSPAARETPQPVQPTVVTVTAPVQPLPAPTPAPVPAVTPPPVVAELPKMVLREEPAEDNADFQLVIKEEAKPAEPVIVAEAAFDDTAFNEEEDQKRRAAERINKLRNLSFNMNSADSGGEYDNVPAYVRRNMELFGNTLTSVEQFYSKYTVKKEDNDETHISSLNTFLDGKKPD